MTYPKFFDEIETIKLKDDLSQFLGAFDDGIIEFSYVDVVKTAGHSCPTVLGAYLMTLSALKELYKNEIPKRGEIKVEFSERSTEGVAGVIANVISNITGACKDTGFKGIAGKFDRNYLLKFESDIGSANARFTRIDTNKSIEIIYCLDKYPADNNMKMLLQKIINKTADFEEISTFRQLWQERVEKISKNIKDVIKINNLN